MLQITAIEQQKKNTQRFNVYIDGRFSFGTGLTNLLKNNLKIGKNLTGQEIEKIVASEETTKLLDLAVNFLSYRPRSEKEISDYLIKKISQRENIKFHEARESSVIATVIKKLKKYNYIDDREFARWFVESRTRTRPKGPNHIKIELLQKGIAKDLIEESLAQITNQNALAQQVLGKKWPRLRNLPVFEQKKKVYQYLASKGFDYDIIGETFAFFSKKK